jgi:hypothetical protein
MSCNTLRYFVQFPHPGKEHNPGDVNRQPWNTGAHRRKFLRSYGSYVGENGSLFHEQLVFWGEWEAPSYVVGKWHREGSLPRFLHDPVWEHPKSLERRQNTDPWVFGDAFVYSNCRQPSQPALRRLTRGSVIIFGSNLAGEFVLDTVFVVAASFSYSVWDSIDSAESFRFCTIEAIRSDPGYARNQFVLYRGATFEAPVNDMYSFAPCRPFEDPNFRFARPRILLPGCYLNPLAQGPKNAGKARSLTELSALWRNVRDQVASVGCLLGVSFQTPPLDKCSDRRSQGCLC